MKHTYLNRNFGAVLFAAAVTLLLLMTGGVRADTIKLKGGKVLEGTITLETDDLVKIRVQRAGSSISETLPVLTSDIESIVKTAPDDLEFAKIKGLQPTPSLVSSSNYEDMIDKGPKAFLNAFAASKHRAEVEKIQKELEAEKARVDQGEIKIEGEWISKENQQNFRELIDARILNLRMRQKAQANNYIGTLRDFEMIEETYFGTPTYPESVTYILQLLPSLGKRLVRMQADVEYVNKTFEEDILKMPEERRAQAMEARKQEEAALRKNFEADKIAGVKWYALNQRDKDDLAAYIQLVSGEIARLQSLDLEVLSAQAKQLVRADELIAGNKLSEAKALLKEASGIKSSRGGSRGKSNTKYSNGYGSYSKGGSRPSTRTRKTSSSKVKTNYPMALQAKILKKEQAIELAETQATNTAEGKETTGKFRSDPIPESADAGTEAETVEGNEGTGASQGGGLAALVAGRAAAAEPEPKTTKPKPKTSRSKPRKSTRTESSDDGDKTAKEKVASGGFKFKFKYVIWGVTALLIVVVGLMKLLGIGANA